MYFISQQYTFYLNFSIEINVTFVPLCTFPKRFQLVLSKRLKGQLEERFVR